MEKSKSKNRSYRSLGYTYRLDKLPSKVVKFIEKQEVIYQKRIDDAFTFITESPFRHPNPTVIKKLRGKKKGLYRFRMGKIRFIYKADKLNKVIRILQIDKRGDIY